MPEFTRRSMLARGLGTLGTVTLGSMTLGSVASGTAAAAEAPNPTADHPMLRRSTFLPAVGATFTATSGSHRYNLRLVEILDLVPAVVADDEHAFNLVFVQTSGPAMSDGIYTLSATRVPECSLFLSPVDRPAAEHRLQAVVNRRSG